MTLRAAIDQYVAWRQAQGARFQAQAYVLRRYARSAVDGVGCDEVSSDEVRAFVDGGATASNNRAYKHSIVGGFYRYAIARGLATHSPLPVAARPKHLDVVGARLRCPRCRRGAAPAGRRLVVGDVGHEAAHATAAGVDARDHASLLATTSRTAWTAAARSASRPAWASGSAWFRFAPIRRSSCRMAVAPVRAGSPRRVAVRPWPAPPSG